MTRRAITILGATGSIGQNTLNLVRLVPSDYEVVALTGGANIAQLAADAIEFSAKLAVIAHDNLLGDLRDALKGSEVKAAAGKLALIEAAKMPCDLTVSAIVGSAGLAPGLAALELGGTLALANKESLVCAGPLLLETARKYGATILPVDSEHSAVFQALVGEDASTVEKVTITASGGPFRDWPFRRMGTATLQQALNHPNWSMGQRITIDSASMFNKAMELIETKEFFGFRPNQIDVLVHPESRVHALVSFVDGAMMAHLGAPDMRHAIGYALNWPDRKQLPVPRLDLASLRTLNFERPDADRFPALRLAQNVMETGGFSGAIFNAAKERALDAFIAGDIGFMRMAEIVETVLTDDSFFARHNDAVMNLENVEQIDQMARQRATTAIEQQKKKV